MKTQTITIQITSMGEALHLQNLAALNIGKYRTNQVQGSEQQQNNLIRLWRDVHTQAGKAIEALQENDEVK